MSIDNRKSIGNIKEYFEESSGTRRPDEPNFDPDDYRAELADFDLTEEQANALLGTLWEMMKAFVELGFGADSIHRFLPVLGAEFEERAASELQSEGGRFVERMKASAQGCADEKDDT